MSLFISEYITIFSRHKGDKDKQLRHKRIARLGLALGTAGILGAGLYVGLKKKKLANSTTSLHKLPLTVADEPELIIPTKRLINYGKVQKRLHLLRNEAANDDLFAATEIGTLPKNRLIHINKGEHQTLIKKAVKRLKQNNSYFTNKIPLNTFNKNVRNK